MKTEIYTIENDYMGIPLLVEGELVDYEDGELPFVVIQEISYGEKPLNLWCLSEAFIKSCQDKIISQWLLRGRG